MLSRHVAINGSNCSCLKVRSFGCALKTNGTSAKVKGDDLLYRGNAVSPHQMAQQAAGAGRNAWREMWIRFPGEKNWKNAAQLRAMMVSQSNRLPLSPADAMASAAKSMSPLSAPHSSSLNTPTINHSIPWSAVCRDIAGSLI
jgi:hypothetical protein